MTTYDERWSLLLPAIRTLIGLNAPAGTYGVIPSDFVLNIDEPAIGHLTMTLYRSGVPQRGVRPWPIEARYWDQDGHATFLLGFVDSEGQLAEVELYRLDQKPISGFPEPRYLEAVKRGAGIYQTSSLIEEVEGQGWNSTKNTAPASTRAFVF